MSDLISLDRAKAQLPNAPSTADGTIALLVTAASGVIENYCNRTFAQATYDELYHGSGTPYLFVNYPPISRVVAVRSGLTPALMVQCADGTNQTQAATVEVTASAVVLVRLYNGTTTTSTFTYASFPTFGDLQTGINALGNGWQATGSSQFSLWQTSDLAIQPGVFSARNTTAALQVYWYSLGSYRTNNDLGEIWSGGIFQPGYNNYRVTYVGGYSTVPDEIQQACAELVQASYASITANPLMQSESIDKYSYTKAAQAGFEQLSVLSRQALNNYRIYRANRYK